VLLPLAALIPVQQRQLATWKTPFGIAEQALRVTRGNYLLMNNYGILKGLGGDKAAAEAAYLAALEAYPDYGPALYNLGLLRLEQKRYAEALPPLLRGMEADQRRGAKAYDAYCGVALCLTFLGRADEAPHYYALAIREDPASPQAYNDWGNLARDTGNPLLALELYRKSLAADPDYALAKRNLEKLMSGMKPAP
jgi:tetratricopeptide (TPR) repeat protein